MVYGKFHFQFFFLVELTWKVDLAVPRQPGRSPVVIGFTE
jgi:hypothetical protein